MKTNQTKTKKTTLIAMISIFFSFMLTLSYPVYAFFRDTIEENVRPTIDIRLLFGMLDESIASGDWGSDTNPYLIMNEEHLLNLYVLQNSPDSFLINENSVFQVSDEFGYPEYVGGVSANQLFGMKSIGNEQYPFVSRLRGVTTTDPSKFITLPTGEVTDTSVFGNIQIVPVPGQVDIGLFGNVGPSEAEGSQLDPSNYIGAISNLLLYNIQVKSTTYGANIPSHNYNVTTGTFETNHIGILVGHAQYVNLEQISVYYSQTNQVAHINAFDISAGDQAKYTTSGGIVGYYKRVVIDGETEYPVSSDGTAQGIGSNSTGLGLGIVYSKDIWTFMEEKTTVGSPAPNSSYDLQTTFGNALYGADNSYFHIGVFTFAHSRQTKGKDRLAKLWSTAGSNQWTIATNGTSGYTSSNKASGPATKYFTKKITRSELVTTSNGTWKNTTTNGLINTSYRSNTNYRYLITYENAGKVYALVRYGSSAIGVEINPANLVIPNGELKYYTFENLSTRTADLNYPPKTEGFSYKYETPTDIEIRYEGTTTTTYNSGAKLQYAVYGDLVTETVGGVTNILDAPRPLRIYTATGVTPTTSFMATASAANPPYVEGYRISPINPTTTFTTYKLQRTGTSSTGSRTGIYATFDPATGFSATNTASAATAFSLYAVRYTTNTSVPAETPQATTYQLQQFTPTTSAPKKTYNMEENVLEYTGTPTDPLATNRYKYTMKSISSLEWYDNDDNIITKGDTALIMSDPTSYYYIRNAQGMDIYFGVNTGIPSPIGPGTINVPEGSIGFTVNGSATTVPKAKVHVIVATDPSQGVEQHITISRFGSGTTLVGDRVIQSRFILPPAPGVPDIGTQPIYLTDGASSYTVYPNFNTLLVAYTFEVDVQTVAVTYFLEASRGTARFVYLAGERLAANDYNPLHENDVQFPTLTGIDYVYSISKAISGQTKNYIATVGSAEYVSSLTIPYFGIKSNPAYNKDEVPPKDHYLITAVTGFNFTYNISRIYDPATEEKYHMYISVLANVNGTGYDPVITVPQLKTIQQNMNFNYTENSYLNTDTYEYIYSDRVVLNINGYLLNDWSVLN